MKDILLKRNKLREDAMKLRNAKFDESVSRKHGMEMDKEQDKIWNKYVFYEKYIKNKERLK